MLEARSWLSVLRVHIPAMPTQTMVAGGDVLGALAALSEAVAMVDLDFATASLLNNYVGTPLLHCCSIKICGDWNEQAGDEGLQSLGGCLQQREKKVLPRHAAGQGAGPAAPPLAYSSL